MSNKTTLILLTIILLFGGAIWYWQEDIEEATEIEEGETQDEYLHQEGFSFVIPKKWQENEYQVKEAVENGRRFISFYWQDNAVTEHRIMEIAIQDRHSEDLQPQPGWRTEQLPSRDDRGLWLIYPEAETAQEVSKQYFAMVREVDSVKESFTWEEERATEIKEVYITAVETDIPPRVEFRPTEEEAEDDLNSLEIHPEVEIMLSTPERKSLSWEQFAEQFPESERFSQIKFRIEIDEELIVSMMETEEGDGL